VFCTLAFPLAAVAQRSLPSSEIIRLRNQTLLALVAVAMVYALWIMVLSPFTPKIIGSFSALFCCLVLVPRYAAYTRWINEK
jgi:hypothetical protein